MTQFKGMPRKNHRREADANCCTILSMEGVMFREFAPADSIPFKLMAGHGSFAREACRRSTTATHTPENLA